MNCVTHHSSTKVDVTVKVVPNYGIRGRMRRLLDWMRWTMMLGGVYYYNGKDEHKRLAHKIYCIAVVSFVCATSLRMFFAMNVHQPMGAALFVQIMFALWYGQCALFGVISLYASKVSFSAHKRSVNLRHFFFS